ncbi:MAG: hypothetical protein JXQ84_08365 [Rhodospirillaceae bacterium]|nr:hypothetical protein [Rhodospirillaceae bacterium]
MQTIGNWITGVLAAALGLLGLFVSSRAKDDYVYGIGLIVTVACALFVMSLLKRVFDQAEHS